MRAIRTVFKWVDRVTAWLAVLALVVTFALVFLNVIMRYVFGTGFAWSEEGARYALMAVIILGVLEVTHLRGHFCVDLLTNAAPKPVLRGMQIVQDAVMLAVMAVLIRGSWQMMLLNWENTTPAMGMPSWLPYGLMLASCFFSLLYLLGHLLEDCGLHLGAEEGGDTPC
ncbi:TRAP transporter small permease [uncultured Oscillibacter sp.]|uniref:TRAP transporter small permease n=1 Tax=uncultured Oscillibacter sp. TaxID=876091 RepID=UPI0025CB88F3|nr:TRAP transporter small permease [uncultured Oscillibacter sp.]